MVTPKASLFDRAMQASFWSMALRGTTRSIGFVRNVVLARILAPEDFGLFGIALLVLSIIERFSESGLKSALVQKKDDIAEYLDTVWTVLAARGVALALALYFSAPYVSRFFEEPAATLLIQALGLTIFLRGIRSTGILYFSRDLEFHRSFVLRSVETVVELIVSVVAAVILKSAWALLLGLVASNLTMAILSFMLHPYRPRIRLDWSQLRELHTYGRWIYLNQMLNFLTLKGDKLIIGKLLGAPMLGAYMLAVSISEVLTLEVARITNDVGFPAYSRMQDQHARLRKWFTTATTLVFSVTFPMAVALALLAVPLTLLVLGTKWTDVATVLPPLAFAGVVRAVGGNAGAILKGIGRPNISFHAGLVSVAVMYASIFPLVQAYGLPGVGFAVLLGPLVSVPIALYRICRLINISFSDVVGVFLPGMVLGVATAMPIFVVMPASGPVPLLQLILIGLLAAAAYLAVAALLWKAGRTGPFSLVSLLRARRERSRRTLSTATR
ncbi:lipopolysaccharide biosynthesis protein [soil metagenome]